MATKQTINYQGISLLSPTYKHNRMTIPKKYKILPDVLLSRLTPYADEIIGDDQWGF